MRSSRSFAGRAVVAGRNHAAVAERAEILRRVEAERRRVADAARAPPLVARAVRLRRILDHDQIVAPRDGQDAIEVDRLAVQVHRHDRLRSRRHRRADRAGVDPVGRRIHVDEYRPSRRPP